MFCFRPRPCRRQIIPPANLNMTKLNRDIVNFFESQGSLVVITIDSKGYPHASCKGAIKIEEEGRLYLMDAYHGQTFKNLKKNPSACVVAFNEHKFKGFCLKGKARLIHERELNPEIIKSWEERLTDRLTQRLLKNIREEKGHSGHPEASLPKPKYMIVLEVLEVVDLTPTNLK